MVSIQGWLEFDFLPNVKGKPSDYGPPSSISIVLLIHFFEGAKHCHKQKKSVAWENDHTTRKKIQSFV